VNLAPGPSIQKRSHQSDTYGKNPGLLAHRGAWGAAQGGRGSGRSVAELVREAIRKIVLKPTVSGPVAIWDGKPKRTSIGHDSIHDQP
jgi:hypothetical protein